MGISYPKKTEPFAQDVVRSVNISVFFMPTIRTQILPVIQFELGVDAPTMIASFAGVLWGNFH